MKNYLNFETDIKNLENELEKLKDPFNQEGLSEVDTKKISKTQEEIDEKLRNIYENLDPWQITLVARHEDRPKSKFFIDTPGAYPGVGAEERGQAEAIAKSIECCMKLKVPTLAIIIGEGGSGGAIALASSNKVLMLENAIYSVISPEGCATILWRDPKKMLDAAKAMKLSAKDLLELNIIDEIIPEPLGGAHRDRDMILENIRNSISQNLDFFKTLTAEEILNHRKDKFLKIGRSKGFISSPESLSAIQTSRLDFKEIIKSKKNIAIAVATVVIIAALTLFIL